MADVLTISNVAIAVGPGALALFVSHRAVLTSRMPPGATA